MAKSDDLSAVIQEQITAALEAKEKQAKRSKDPESMAELIDRISDVTVDKLLERLAGGEHEEEEEEVAPVADHPFFKPLFGRPRSA